MEDPSPDDAGQKTAYEIRLSLVGSEMCIRDRHWTLEILAGHCQAFLIVVPAGLTLATVVGEPHCCSVVTVNTSNTVQLLTFDNPIPVSYTHLTLPTKA